MTTKYEPSKEEQQAIALAQKWLQASQQVASSKEKKEQKKYQKLVSDSKGKYVLTHLLDRAFRSTSPKRIVEQAKYLFGRDELPHFLKFWEKWLIGGLQKYGAWIPTFTSYALTQKIRWDVRHVILSGEEPALSNHLLKRQKDGVSMNLNILGEMVLGEREAANRLNDFLKALKRDDVDYISIKVSGIFSQIHPLGYQESKEALKQRLAQLYRQAQKCPSKRTGRPKFINLDMEEYRDTELTIDVFKETLEQEEFVQLYAGIVLQAYLPDSWQYQKELIEWSKGRVQNGGSPIKIRLVKGANLQMEAVESSIHGWECPVVRRKVEADANYKRMLETAIVEENMKVAHLGVASHNLFDLAYASVLADKENVWSYFTFEMLEGMAESLWKTLLAESKPVLLYTPVAESQHFLNAVAYLVRRLDENTSPENFLAHSFGLQFPSPEWDSLKEQFLESCQVKAILTDKPYRDQNRQIEEAHLISYHDPFTNEPDTDWHLPQNRFWAEEIRKKWQKSKEDDPIIVPIQVGSEQRESANFKDFYDPNTSDEERICVYRVALSDQKNVLDALEIAETDPSCWSQTTTDERCQILSHVAQEFRKKRGDMIGCMASVTGKAFLESDPEISEAIDFAEYYHKTFKEFQDQMPHVALKPKGVVLVIAPWNFPMAIPAGGALAALACGNRVLLKPAPEAFPVAWEFAQCFWNAGVPKEAFQIVCCEEGAVLDSLVEHESIKHIIFTGGTETALRILEKRHDIPLSAETGGKNATIISATADLDQAVKDVVQSAFGNSGQKCSCTSLLIVEKDVFDEPQFAEKLKDAAESFKIGSAWDLSSDAGPMIQQPNELQKRGFTELRQGEQWLVQTKAMTQKINTPAVRWNTPQGSFPHQCEFFAPILSVIRAENLQHAVELANATEYGLTSGLQSLDEREQEYWRQNIQAGNLYINRGTTGAIVRRQPFGGLKKSAMGQGTKAGGPNYVLQFCHIEEKQLVPDKVKVGKSLPELQGVSQKSHALHSIKELALWYEQCFQENFSHEVDFSKILGQHNFFRYIPAGLVMLRVGKKAKKEDALISLFAAYLAKNSVKVSIEPQMTYHQELKKCAEFLHCDHKEEDFDAFVGASLTAQRIRTVGCQNDEVKKLSTTLAKVGKQVLDASPLKDPRIEMLYYLQEQSLSANYHRYGYLGLQ